MGEQRTAWHPGFAAYVESETPPGVVVEAEVVLAQQQRADLILVRREGPTSPPSGPLRRLWEVLPRLALIEYKSRSGRPRPGDLHQLLGYGHILARSRFDELSRVADLGLVLAAPELSEVVKKDLARFGVAAEALGGGLYGVEGLGFPTWVLSLNEMSTATGRGVLGFFGSQRVESLDVQSRGWLRRYYHVGNIDSIKELPDFDEMDEELARSDFCERALRRRIESASVEDIIRLFADGGRWSELEEEVRRRLGVDEDR